MISDIPGNSQECPKYPRVKRSLKIPDSMFQHSYPTRIRPATCYIFQYPTRPDLEKPYQLGTAILEMSEYLAIWQGARNISKWDIPKKNIKCSSEALTLAQ